MAKALSKSSFCFWMLPRRSYALPRLERVVATSQWSGPNSRSCTTPYRWSCGWGRLQKTCVSTQYCTHKKIDELAVGSMKCMYEINFRTFVRCPVRFPISVQMYVSSFQLLHWRLNNSEIIKKRGSMTSLQSRHSESTCREWDMCPSWISRAFSKWSLSCAASPQRPYLGWLVGDQLVWSKQLRIEEISSTTYKVQENVSASDLTVPDIPIIRCWGLMISQTGKSIHIPLSVSTMVSLSSKLSTFWTEILAPLHAMLCVASFSNFRFMFGGDGFLIYLHWVRPFNEIRHAKIVQRSSNNLWSHRTG